MTEAINEFIRNKKFVISYETKLIFGNTSRILL
jgi:hypothetical protein